MKYKACWISDLHLGSRKAQAEIIYRFLKDNEFDTLYLVGDIIDIWRWQQVGLLSKNIAQDHINIIQRILKLSKKGTKVHYITGNHDEFLEHFTKEGMVDFGNISISSQVIHVSSLGKKYITVHGHQFDLITMTNPWLAKIGDRGYEFFIWLNRPYNVIRKKLGFGYFSLSKHIKVKVKEAANFIANFESAAMHYLIDKDCDGIIVGHIHEPKIKQFNNKVYLNSGCWTDISNCNALVERESGHIDLIQWTEAGEVILKSTSDLEV